MEEVNPILHLEQVNQLKQPAQYYSPDLAIKAYHDALDEGLSKEEAEKRYFEYHKTHRKWS